MPRYELGDKFWEIERDAKGKALTIRAGTIGTKGKLQKKRFAQPFACSKAWNDLVHAQLGKGYRIATGERVARAPRHDNPALEAAVCDEPADVDRWLVYADWLQQESDPRGELIALRAAKKTQKATKHAARHADALWGEAKFLTRAKPFADRIWEGWSNKPEPYTTLAVQLAMSPLGMVQAARFSGLDEHGHIASAVGALLEAPIGRFVQELHFEIGEEFEGQTGLPGYDMVAKVLGHAKPRALRTLSFASGGYQRSWTSSGDLAGVWAGTPNLERLEIRLGNIALGKLALPKLRSLRLVTGGLDGNNVREIAAASWPALEELVVYLGTPRYGGNATTKVLTALLANPFPKLRRLALCNSEEHQGQIARALVGSKLVKQLAHLDLSRGTMIDADAQVLVDAAKSLGHLQLDVSENYFSPAAVKLLRTTFGKRIDVTGQRYDDMVSDRAQYGHEDWAVKQKATFRYAAIGE